VEEGEEGEEGEEEHEAAVADEAADEAADEVAGATLETVRRKSWRRPSAISPRPRAQHESFESRRERRMRVEHAGEIERLVCDSLAAAYS